MKALGCFGRSWKRSLLPKYQPSSSQHAKCSCYFAVGSDHVLNINEPQTTGLRPHYLKGFGVVVLGCAWVWLLCSYLPKHLYCIKAETKHESDSTGLNNAWKRPETLLDDVLNKLVCLKNTEALRQLIFSLSSKMRINWKAAADWSCIVLTVGSSETVLTRKLTALVVSSNAENGNCPSKFPKWHVYVQVTKTSCGFRKYELWGRVGWMGQQSIQLQPFTILPSFLER